MRMRALAILFTAAVAAVSGTAVPAFAAEGTIVGAGAPGAIPGRYIVTLKGGASAGGAVSAAAAGSYTASMSARAARRLAARSGVAFVEQDRTLHVAAATQRNPSWNLDRVDQRSVSLSKTYTPMDDGNSVTAYVIDTGVRVTHSQFGGRARSGYDFVDGDTNANDCNGHGTHVAGTIGGATYGVAKKVKIVAVRVLNCRGAGSLSDVIAGIDWVTARAVKPAVANMSMGGGYSPSLEAAVQRSIRAGVTYAVAAGNEDVNAAYGSPAGVSAAITVGATDSRDRRASFSNYGSVLDLFAPGVGVRSAYSTSNTATAVLDGTSMASPAVAGAAALVLDAYPSMTPAQVRNFLVTKATTGKVTDRRGSPNRLLYVPPPAVAPTITSTALSVRPGTPLSTTLSLTAARRGWWTLAAGRLPTGLKLSSNGVISGTPTGPGTSTVTVRFTDYVPNVVTRVLRVTTQKTTPSIATRTLSDAAAGTPYSTRLAITDARSGTWALIVGVLPAGLTLSSAGSLTGTPTEAGTSTFQVRFTDAWGTATTQDLTLTVN